MAAPQPTLAGFLLFLRNVVGISTTVLPDDSPVIPMAFAVALGIVNPQLQCIPIPSTDPAGVTLNSGGITIFSLAVYNLASDNVFNYAQDQPDAPVYKNGKTYFDFFQDKWQINAFVSGVIASASDNGTGDSLVVQEAARAFTLSNLQNLKTPWGRTYLGFAQQYGPSTWGIS